MIVTKEAVHAFHSHLKCTFCHGLQSCLKYIYELQLGSFKLDYSLLWKLKFLSSIVTISQCWRWCKVSHISIIPPSILTSMHCENNVLLTSVTAHDVKTIFFHLAFQSSIFLNME